MKLLDKRRMALAVAGVCGAVVSAATAAEGSVSVAADYDGLVRGASMVAVITPIAQQALWEDGRIMTYTHARVDRAIAGPIPSSSAVWIRTRGGVVGAIGQSVDGEPVFAVGHPSLVFLHEAPPGAFFVTARAQGQFPIVLDGAGRQVVVRNRAAGVLLSSKATSPSGGVSAQSVGGAAAPAVDVLEGRSVDDIARELGAAWSRVHAR